MPNHEASELDVPLPHRPRGSAESGLQERIVELCAEFSRYGYRRITCQLQAEGMVVNHKAVALMRQKGLQVRPLRKLVRTTDSDHDGPIFRGFCPPPAPISSGSAI
jgi:putative transposase